MTDRALRVGVEDIDDEPTLVRWLRLVGTRSADEIAVAIRSFRASECPDGESLQTLDPPQPAEKKREPAGGAGSRGGSEWKLV